MARLALLLVLLLVLLPARRSAAEATVDQYAVYEASVSYAGTLANPWIDATLTVSLIRPDGSTLTIEGFYYGGSEWRFRVAPTQPGRWTWRARLASSRTLAEASGTFTALPASGGFPKIQTKPAPARLVQGDGSPFPIVGHGDCLLDLNRDGVLEIGNDQGRELPEAPGHRYSDVASYAELYGAAGFNLFRFSVANCSFPISEAIAPGGNRYREREGKLADDVIRTFRANGFKIMFVLFGFDAPFGRTATTDELQAVSQYARYVVARYGAMVDIWELMNEVREDDASDPYLSALATAIRDADPYDHPISTSFERPGHPAIEINAPHWYVPPYDDTVIDRNLLGKIDEAQQFGKPVIVGEFGNSGANWDSRSAFRMRIHLWTALVGGASLVFWNTSAILTYKNPAANIYLGAEERSAVRAYRRFADLVGRDDVPFEPVIVRWNPDAAGETMAEQRVRGYGLRSASSLGIYLYHRTTNTQPVSSIVRLFVAAPARAIWTDPATATVLADLMVGPGAVSIESPPFTTDVALRLVPPTSISEPRRAVQATNVLVTYP